MLLTFLLKSGIGLDVAHILLEKGYKVAISGRRVEHGEAVAKKLDADGQRVVFFQCDVSSYSSQASLFEQVWSKWGRLDVVVANAGHLDTGSVYNLTRKSAAVTDLPSEPEPDLSSTDTNFEGVIYSTTLSTHFMRHNKTPGGKVIITGSIIGTQPNPARPEYCAAKAAVAQWCRGVAPVLLEKENIAVNCVLPGPYDTAAMPDSPTAFKPEQYVPFSCLMTYLANQSCSLTFNSCILAAYDLFLDDDARSRIGQTVETAHDKLFQYEIPEHKNGDVAKRAATVFEP